MTHPHTPAQAVPPITEEDIAEFLANTPGFFERHAELLTGVVLTSPHGQRAVSLQERQAEMLREKIKGLEQRIMEMVRHSHENTAIALKIHQWTRELAQAGDPALLPGVVEQGIRRLFDVPQAALRLWDVAGPYAGAAFAQGASADARSFATSLTQPFCGPNLGFEPAGWLSEPASVQSIALLPLRQGSARWRRAGLRPAGAGLARSAALRRRHGHRLPRAHGRTGQLGALAPALIRPWRTARSRWCPPIPRCCATWSTCAWKSAWRSAPSRSTRSTWRSWPPARAMRACRCCNCRPRTSAASSRRCMRAGAAGGASR